jgi:hypothetical protein
MKRITEEEQEVLKTVWIRFLEIKNDSTLYRNYSFATKP